MALSAVVNCIQEVSDCREERDIFLARLPALMSALVTITQQQVFERQNMAVRDGDLEPGSRDVEKAFAVLLGFADSAHRQQWDAAVEALMDFPSLNDDQLYQAHQHAKEKRRLLLSYNFLNAKELADLLPDKLSLGKNLGRTLARWVDEHWLLGMQVRGSWKYPAIQINNQGEIFPQLPALIKSAVAAGYNHWEIMSWLLRPTKNQEDVVVGKPLPDFNLDTPVDELFELAQDAAESEHPLYDTPIHLLRTGQNDVLQRVLREWLGLIDS